MIKLRSKRGKMRYLVFILMLTIPLFTVFAEGIEERISEFAEDHPYSLSGTFEGGFLSPISHKIQFGEENGTYFDYVSDGAQDVLFAFKRFSLDLKLNEKHSLVFLYQPLALETREVLSEDILIDTTHFPTGTPMRFLYGFPFWRVSYLYNFADGSRDELSIGMSLQLRDATIEFESEDGSLFTANRNVGPVPIIKFRVKKYFDSGLWLGSEIDGFYAPVSYINGSNNEVIGAILDASVRAGLDLPKNSEAFLNLRYLGGGAVGSSENVEGPGDGYTKNWLHFLTVSVGISHGIL